MLRRVSFRNFKALRDVAIDLEPLTIIVGPNSSGKSSILEGIFHLIESAHVGASNYFTEQLHPTYLMGSQGRVFEISGSGKWLESEGTQRIQVSLPNDQSRQNGARHLRRLEGSYFNTQVEGSGRSLKFQGGQIGDSSIVIPRANSGPSSARTGLDRREMRCPRDIVSGDCV